MCIRSILEISYDTYENTSSRGSKSRSVYARDLPHNVYQFFREKVQRDDPSMPEIFYKIFAIPSVKG